MLRVLVDDMIEFNMQGVFRIVRIVRTISFVLHAHLLEGNSIDAHRIGYGIIFCALCLLVENCIPVGLCEKDFDGLDGCGFVECCGLCLKDFATHNKKQRRYKEFHGKGIKAGSSGVAKVQRRAASIPVGATRLLSQGGVSVKWKKPHMAAFIMHK